jgi:hypothetical protein
MRRSLARKLGSLFLALTAACGLFGDEDPSISLAASTTNAVVQQSGSLAVTLEIGRTNFEKPVQLAVEGTLPTGVTAIFTQNPVAAGSNTTTLNISASGSAIPGTAALTIKATGEGIAEKAILIDVTVTVRGSHTVALTTSSMNVAQGGGGQSTVLLARQNNNAGSVTLSASGAPSGMTVTFGESPTTSASTSVTVTASAAVAPGSYSIAIAGSQPGLTPNPAPAVLAVTVIAAPSTASMSIPFCASSMPVWFAHQNNGFLWQRVSAAGNSFTFAATEKLGIAFAFQNGGASDVRFYFGTRAELSGMTDRDCAGPKNHTGTTANSSSGSGAAALVAMGPTLEAVSNNAFLLEGVPDRPLDLVATRGTLTPTFLYTPDRLVIRRGVSLPNNASIPVIDYLGGESAAPVSNTLTIAGVDPGEDVYVENLFLGTTGTTGLLCSTQAAASVHTMCSAPAASLVAGDLHELYIDAFGSTTAHTMVSYFAAPGDRNETLGPQLSLPSVTIAATTPYLRERGQLTAQTAYPTAVRFVFLQGQSPNSKFVVVVVTAAYLGLAPATWDVVVPDVSGTAGFNSAWMHGSGTNTAFSAEAFSAPGPVLFGAYPSAGQVLKLGYRQSTISTSVGSALRAAAAAQRRPTFDRRRSVLNPPPQYLRR